MERWNIESKLSDTETRLARENEEIGHRLERTDPIGELQEKMGAARTDVSWLCQAVAAIQKDLRQLFERMESIEDMVEDRMDMNEIEAAILGGDFED